MIGHRSRIPLATLCCLCGVLGGCGRSLETSYGSSRGTSINGTAVLAEMFRARGDEVKTAFRLTEEVQDWADVIVRFSPYPGLPDRTEGAWYEVWLASGDTRRLVYVARDFEAGEEYWDAVLAQLDPAADEEVRQRAETERDQARTWVSALPGKVKHPANPVDWFRVGPAIQPPKRCAKLGGPWAQGIAADQASITIHEPFERGSEDILLEGDGHPLAIDWPTESRGRVLAIANGSFLLNATLANPTRRRLASNVLAWASPGTRPRRVAFVEGAGVLSEIEGPPSIWDLLVRVTSFRWVAIQMGILGLAACLARAPRLGRPRPDSTGGIDRPSAHAEALGELLSRTHSHEHAAQTLEQYRSWRHGRSAGS